MATLYDGINAEQRELIEGAQVFFVASADPTLSGTSTGLGAVNVSPKGGVPLHIITPNHVAYLDYPGSGNETARHATAGGPITLMVSSFDEGDAAIVRLFGRAVVERLEESELEERMLDSQAAELVSAPRQVVNVYIDKTQTSCGYGVPVMSYVRDRRKEDRGRRYKG